MLLMFESKHEKGLGHTLKCPYHNKTQMEKLPVFLKLLSVSENKINNFHIAHAEVEDSSCQYLRVSSH